ncbi:hypothetical protein C8R42DRAFT_656188 [Lentinula raphanica]|nr:hypothetical protein C8R42DRAFT_656188 [Lentinula raphanica]
MLIPLHRSFCICSLLRKIGVVYIIMGPTAVIDILFHIKLVSFAFPAASTSGVMSVMVMHKCHSVKNFTVWLIFVDVSCSRNYSFCFARYW